MIVWSVAPARPVRGKGYWREVSNPVGIVGSLFGGESINYKED